MPYAIKTAQQHNEGSLYDGLLDCTDDHVQADAIVDLKGCRSFLWDFIQAIPQADSLTFVLKNFGGIKGSCTIINDFFQ